jgi:hypothetical protein
MCDYSLQYIASRPAQIGDKLVTKGFAGTYTRGFAAVGEPTVAVCLRPGTEIAFESEVSWDRPFGIFRRKQQFGKVVRFRQINPDNPHTHHDVVEFPNGKIVPLTKLCEGQKATVIQLPADPRVIHQTQERADAPVPA